MSRSDSHGKPAVQRLVKVSIAHPLSDWRDQSVFDHQRAEQRRLRLNVRQQLALVGPNEGDNLAHAAVAGAPRSKIAQPVASWICSARISASSWLRTTRSG